jgi:rod shape-determining protein MreD
MIIILIGISLILDGVLTNYLPYLPNNLSLFTPLLTITSLFFIYRFYRKQEKKYYFILGIIGIIYDLFYTNLLLFHAVIFIFLGVIIKQIYKNYEITSIRIIIYIIIMITIYEFSTGFILFIFQLVPITIEKIIYKIIHSLILNIIWAEVLY